MTTKQPTEPGSYHWRAKEGDKWEILSVFLPEEHGPLWVLNWRNGDHSLVQRKSGQWQRIPNPDEMQEAWAVRCPAGQYAHVGTEDETITFVDRLNETDMFLSGQEYTCKPVYIVRRESEEGEI
jgi:hypothetical protein